MTSVVRGRAKPSVFFYVQHLLGVGHVFRAQRITHALADDGFDVCLAIGGTPVHGLDVSGLDVIELPPVKAGTNTFSDLVQLDGTPADTAFKNARRDRLVGAFEHVRPDILLIEAFPFGRRQMRFELLPLLQAARQGASAIRVVCSVRDILQENRKPGRDDETLETLRQCFDHVIVHGDPSFASLDETFPRAREIACPISYSGYVAPRWKPVSDQNVCDVIVSAGGGVVGGRLLAAAIDAKHGTSLADARWLCLTGKNMPTDQAADLRRQAESAGIEIADFKPNLAGELARARLSISQAGYNTVADILVAGCAAVYVPFAAGGETEQTRRAGLLERAGAGAVVNETDLNPMTLISAVERALAMPRQAVPFALDGAQQTARILRSLL